MPRHVLLLLIAALALLLGAATAQAAPSSAAAPAAHVAQDDEVLDDEGCAPDDDACLDEEWDAEGFDDELACEDDWADEEWVEGDEEVVVDEEIAEAANADDCGDETAEQVVAPDLTSLTTTVAGEGARLSVTVGFRLDEPGRVELTLARVAGAATSRRAAAACTRSASAAARRSGRAKGKACPRTLPGKVIVVGRAGANTHQLRGTWRGRRLAPGSYRLTATPKAPGATSDTVAFRIAPKQSGRA